MDQPRAIFIPTRKVHVSTPPVKCEGTSPTLCSTPSANASESNHTSATKRPLFSAKNPHQAERLRMVRCGLVVQSCQNVRQLRPTSTRVAKAAIASQDPAER